MSTIYFKTKKMYLLPLKIDNYNSTKISKYVYTPNFIL